MSVTTGQGELLDHLHQIACRLDASRLQQGERGIAHGLASLTRTMRRRAAIAK